MLSKEEIETCKQELDNYIEFMESAGDNAGWARGLRWYIKQLETQKQKVIDKLEKDKMEQFDDYTIHLIESYLKILKGDK